MSRAVFYLYRAVHTTVSIQMDWLALISLLLILGNFTYRDQLIPHCLIPTLKTHFQGLAQLSGLNG